MVTRIRKVGFLSSLISLIAISIEAQFQSKGKLNAWTTSEISRNHETGDYAQDLCSIRFAEQKGFDRLVFEFDKGKSNYIIAYLPSDILKTKRARIK